MTPWYHHHANLMQLVDWLYEDDPTMTVKDVVHVLEKPWNWEAEYKEMRRAQDDAEPRQPAMPWGFR